MLTLRAYFDESGKFNDPRETVTCIGGCIAPVPAWEKFEPAWNAILKKFGVSHLHMKHFAHSTGEYKGWTEEKRRALMRQLLSVMEGHIRKPIGAVLPLSQYAELTPAQKEILPDPYVMCFQDCLSLAGMVADELYDRQAIVQLIFATRQKGDGAARQAYQLCKEKLPIGSRLASISFKTPFEVPPLQAADLVAYELTQLGRDMLDPKSSPLEEMRWPMQELVAKFFPEFQFYTLERLVERVSPNHTSPKRDP